MKLFRALGTLSFFVSAWLTITGVSDLFWASAMWLLVLGAAWALGDVAELMQANRTREFLDRLKELQGNG